MEEHRTINKTSHKKAYFLIVVALILVLASGLFLANIPKKSANSPSNTAAKNMGTHKNVTSIPEVNTIENIEAPTSKPLGWKNYNSTNEDIILSHPPDLTVKEVVQPAPSGSTARSTIINFTNDAGVIQSCCKIVFSSTSFSQSKKVFESSNTGDDSAISTKPGRILINITEKDEFSFKGHDAVRYAYSKRISYRSDLQKYIIYMVQSSSGSVILTSQYANTDELNLTRQILENLVIEN